MHHTTQTQNLKSTFWPCVLDLIQGYKSHKRVLRSISDTIHAVPSALFPLFQCDTAALPGEAGNDRLSKIWHLTRPVTSSVTFRYNLATYSESSNPELSNLVLGSRIRPALWQIAGGGETTPTPSACRVREYPCIGARVNPRPPGGSDSISPSRFFVNNVLRVTCIDAKLCIPLRLSILRPYTKCWMIFSTLFWVIPI